FVARCANDSSPDQLGNLNGGTPYPASGCQDQDILTGLQVGPRYQHVPGCQEGQRHGRSLCKAEGIGQWECIRTGNLDVLRQSTVRSMPNDVICGTQVVLAGKALSAMSTTQPWRQNHRIANPNTADLTPSLRNDARDVVTQNMWHFDFESWQPLKCPQVKMIQC